MYNRGSCTWPVSRIFHVQLFFMYINESRIFYVQPFSHVHDHNQEWFLYINYVQPCFQGLVQLKYVHKSWKTSAKWPELASTRLNTPIHDQKKPALRASLSAYIWPKTPMLAYIVVTIEIPKYASHSIFLKSPTSHCGNRVVPNIKIPLGFRPSG